MNSELRQKLTNEAWHRLNTGSTLREISEDMGYKYHTIYEWLTNLVGEPLGKFMAGARAKRALMFRKLGYSMGETAYLLCRSKSAVLRALRHEPKGNPCILIQFSGTCHDINGNTIPVETYAKLSWVDDQTAMVMRHDTKQSSFYRWSELMGNAQYRATYKRGMSTE